MVDAGIEDHRFSTPAASSFALQVAGVVGADGAVRVAPVSSRTGGACRRHEVDGLGVLRLRPLAKAGMVSGSSSG